MFLANILPLKHINYERTKTIANLIAPCEQIKKCNKEHRMCLMNFYCYLTKM